MAPFVIRLAAAALVSMVSTVTPYSGHWRSMADPLLQSIGV